MCQFTFNLTILRRIDPLLCNGSINTFPRRQTLGKQPVAGQFVQQRDNKGHPLIGDGPMNTYSRTREEGCFPWSPCRGNMRESNSEAGSCRSTIEFKEHRKVQAVARVQRSTEEYKDENGGCPSDLRSG
jgi:hypothetical protein